LDKGGHEVFALDIGTRTIAGLIVRKEGKNYKILASRILEHESRVMYDGQIHDIEAVAKSVGIIKKELEKKLDRRLEKAAVAAAGRALYTVEPFHKQIYSRREKWRYPTFLHRYLPMQY
jgi:cell division ATPase FtsA